LPECKPGKGGQHNGVGWIDSIYNNTARQFKMRSVDSEHNGAISNDRGEKFALDDQKWHAFAANNRWHADWCGISWYFRDLHYKELSINDKTSFRFYQSQVDGKNWVIFRDGPTDHPIGRQEVPKTADYHCVLRVENNGIFLDVVNDDGTTQEVLAEIYDQTKYWVHESLGALGTVLMAAAGGA
jgi:hypothetical protein